MKYTTWQKTLKKEKSGESIIENIRPCEKNMRPNECFIVVL
jgi:hypothetical protein